MAGPRVVNGMDSGEVVTNGGGARKGGIQCWGHRGASGMSFPLGDIVCCSSVVQPIYQRTHLRVIAQLSLKAQRESKAVRLLLLNA